VAQTSTSCKFMELKYPLTVLWELILSVILYKSSAKSSTTFSATVKHSTGTVLCSLDRPSEQYDVDPSTCGLPQCAWICSKMKCCCIGFNFNTTAMKCDIFFYVPLNYSTISGCYHYHVSTLLFLFYLYLF